MVGPTTAVVHGDRDRAQLLPADVASGQKREGQLKALERMLWGQFGMAACEGVVEREDLLTGTSHLKPRLAELADTFLFLDSTTTPSKEGKGATGGGGGLGGLFSSLVAKKDPGRRQRTPQPKETSPPSGKCWLDVDLIQSAANRGSGVFVVCESQHTAHCATLLGECLSSIPHHVGDDDIERAAVATIVAPDVGVALGDEGDAEWVSMRPQDLEGELSEPLSIRDGTRDPPAADGGAGRSAGRRPPSLSRRDLAEVCVQCALRLPTSAAMVDGEDGGEEAGARLRVVRVAPRGAVADEAGSVALLERPNEDYFSRTGSGATAGVVASADWPGALALLCREVGGRAGVRVFPKGPNT